MSQAAPFEFVVAPPGAAEFLHVFRTRAGWAAILGRDDVLSRVFLPAASREHLLSGLALAGSTAKPSSPSRELADAVAAVVNYFAGVPVDPAAVPVRFDPGTMGPFALRVSGCLRRVPRGRTITYGELAAAAGSPGAARAVGVAMSRNKFPLFVPCHRVLAHGGALGGFSAPGGLADKRKMLTLERGS